MLRGCISAGIPTHLLEEYTSGLTRGAGVRIERIVSRGHSSPPGFWYDQDEHEYVLLVQGFARIEIEGVGELTLRAGDWVDIAAHERHRVTWTDPTTDTIWLTVFYSPE